MLIQNFIDFINTKQKIDPKIILDIGSRDLDQSIEFNSIFPNSVIHAFEPNPDQFAICEEASKNYPNIHVHQLAISNKKETLKFYRTIGNIGASSLLEPIDVPFGWTKEYNIIDVESERLDSWLKNNNIKEADILWMDAQGVELLALEGMGEFLKDVKFIHCEASEKPYYKGHILKEELEKFLVDSGFEIEFHPVFHPYGEGDIFAVNKRFN